MTSRLASPGESVPRAAKDCRTCNRRRIKCDKSLPTCKKCEIKNLTCPGYGLRIQWDQGVASRGKLTGKTLPILEHPEPSHHKARPPKKPSQVDQSRSAEKSSGSLVASTFAGGAGVESRSHDDNTAELDEAFRHEFAIDLGLSLCPLPSFLQDHSAQKLIHYYDNVVAAAMPWIDGPDNAWRTQILPLSMGSPSLLLGILALAAEHSSARLGESWSVKNNIASRNYRDKSLELLAQELRTEALEEMSMARQGPANAMLATILVLCNLEMVQSNSAIWQVHWQAARTIVRRWTSSKHLLPSPDATSRFLVNEAFMIDVFASSTIFDGDGQIPGSVIDDGDYNVFVEYLQLLQEVTVTERRRNAGTISSSIDDLDSLRKRFEYTRMSSLHYSRNIDVGSEELRQDFECIIDIFHHAGVIYGCQALFDLSESAQLREHSLDELFQILTLIKNPGVFQQDLIWPLFIAGTESRGDSPRQELVESKILQAMKFTGFSNPFQALLFLRNFWTTDELTATSWMQFACQEAKRGTTFLVL